MIQIPFLDLQACNASIKDELDQAYGRFFQSGQLVLGPETASFEEEYAAYCEAKYCVGVSNGLDALHLALVALGIGKGDEVIVPSNTYIATWLAVTQVGAIPFAVEPDPETFNINPEAVAEVVGPNTKAILAVNLYGQPCDYDRLLDCAENAGIPLLIDNAQAHGARYKGRRVGGIARVECHSFYPTKNLGALGEAGAITTNDATIADRIRLLRNYGSRVRYMNEVAGYNCRIDELQAAFLRVKLRYLDSWNARRHQIAKSYHHHLSSCPHVTIPEISTWAEPVWHLYVIRCLYRDSLQKWLSDRGIQTLVHYPIAPPFSDAYSTGSVWRTANPRLDIAKELGDSVLSLPLHPAMQIAWVDEVATEIRHFSSSDLG